MAVTKPTTVPRFATNGAAVTEPTEEKKDLGWVPGEKPSAQVMNWLFLNLYRVAEWSLDIADQVMSWTRAHTFTPPAATTAVTVNSAADSPAALRANTAGTAVAVRAASTGGTGAAFYATATGATQAIVAGGTGTNTTTAIITSSGGGNAVYASTNNVANAKALVGNGIGTLGKGVEGTGGDGGFGVHGLVSTGTGAGVRGTHSGNYRGVWGSSVGDAGVYGEGVHGVWGDSANASGWGGRFANSGDVSRGLYASGIHTDGVMKLTGTPPNYWEGFGPAITARNTIRMWTVFRIYKAPGSSIVQTQTYDGFNRNDGNAYGPSWHSGAPLDIRVGIGSADGTRMSTGNYCVIASTDGHFAPFAYARETAVVTLRLRFMSTGSYLNFADATHFPSGASLVIHMLVVGY